jgi:nucleotide-binding universal stress UspA family protein
MYKKILVPLDGSSFAEAAVRHAYPLARSQNAEIVLLSVVVFPTRDFDVIPMKYAVSDEVKAETKRYLEQVAGSLRRVGIRTSTFVESGYVAETIIDFAAQHQIDLIVMSTHGRTGPVRWLLGSVAFQIVQHAHVPVLLVRPSA